jgi:ribosomal protein L11 methyltransferase
MDYYQLCICARHEEDLLTGILAQWPFESFMDTEKGFSAYIPVNKFSENLKESIYLKLSELGIDDFEFELIKAQNWNEEWEKNFQAVSIHDFCNIRADFHLPNKKVKYDLVINPKMAFGTGHHETTWMMIDRMRQLELKGKSLFDYGTGTGVLAILAQKMGASPIAAIDYDVHSIENAWENAEANAVHDLAFQQAELKDLIGHEPFDVILANINYPVLLDSAEALADLTLDGGVLLLSGILNRQVDKVSQHYAQYGFKLEDKSLKGDWVCLQFNYKKV